MILHRNTTKSMEHILSGGKRSHLLQMIRAFDDLFLFRAYLCLFPHAACVSSTCSFVRGRCYIIRLTDHLTILVYHTTYPTSNTTSSSFCVPQAGRLLPVSAHQVFESVLSVNHHKYGSCAYVGTCNKPSQRSERCYSTFTSVVVIHPA